MAFEVTGPRGALRAGGRPAVVFDRFKFFLRSEDVGGGWRVEAHLLEKDDYWLDRDIAMELRLDLSKSRWRFRDVPRAAVVVDGDTVTITHHGDPEDV